MESRGRSAGGAATRVRSSSSSRSSPSKGDAAAAAAAAAAGAGAATGPRGFSVSSDSSQIASALLDGPASSSSTISLNTRMQLPRKVDGGSAALRYLWGPLGIMVFSPIVTLMVGPAVLQYKGAVVDMLLSGTEWITRGIYAPSMYSVKIIAVWLLLQYALLWVLPGATFLGPVTPANVRPRYKLNGVLAWFVSNIAVFGVAYPMGWINPLEFYRNFGSMLVTLNFLAIVLCVFLYVRGLYFPSCKDATYTGHRLLDFFQGIELHPRLGPVNVKQWINCRVSMMAWSVSFGLFALAQYELYGYVSTSMIASNVCLMTYLFKFFVWESGYFWSLDIMHDHFGYYLAWGLLAWVPAVYMLPAFWLTEHPTQLSVPLTVLIIALGFAAILINYSADEQRQRVRATAGKTTIWGRAPQIIHAAYTTIDGETHKSILLTNGWWGVARHFHYLPELSAAFLWCCPGGIDHVLPLFYFVFLVILLVDRSHRDEMRCSEKYGKYWAEYCRRVPYRMVPGIY